MHVIPKNRRSDMEPVWIDSIQLLFILLPLWMTLGGIIYAIYSHHKEINRKIDDIIKQLKE
jgi:hypothetical protein